MSPDQHHNTILSQRGQPLILSLKLEEQCHSFFETQRRRYFPAYCNFLPAHLTLFHHITAPLPVINELLVVCCRRPPVLLELDGLWHWRTGVAYQLRSPVIAAWHAELQGALKPWLVLRDQQLLRPHITIQNKVTALKAQRLYEQLSCSPAPLSITGLGVDAWYQRKGLWEHAHTWLFDPA